MACRRKCVQGPHDAFNEDALKSLLRKRLNTSRLAGKFEIGELTKTVKLVYLRAMFLMVC